MMGAFNHTAGGYLIYKSSEYQRITRFRPNGVPMDGPGHYIYIRDDGYQFFTSDFTPDGFDCLRIDPCIPAEWTEFSVTRRWRGAMYEIHVSNPDGVEKGVKQILADGKEVSSLPVLPVGSLCRVEVIMG